MPLYVNEHEIQEFVNRFDRGDTPNLLAGAEVLYRLCSWTNSHSDGWPYWAKPKTAAEKLMRLLTAADRFDPTDCTDAELKAALKPIKSFLARQEYDAGGHDTVFPPPPPPPVFQPRILKMLDLSTKHLTEALGQELNAIPGIVADHREYGWLLWVPQDIDSHVRMYSDEDHDHPIPDIVVGIWRYAARHGCQYVMFDSDAGEVPDLPTWDW